MALHGGEVLYYVGMCSLRSLHVGTCFHFLQRPCKRQLLSAMLKVAHARMSGGCGYHEQAQLGNLQCHPGCCCSSQEYTAVCLLR
jgi:hypothetical protein